MSSLYIRKNSQYIWIKWYDKNTHKNCYASTKIIDNPSGRIKAKAFKREFDSEVIIRHRKQQTGIAGNQTLDNAFHHYLKNNAGKNPFTLYEYENFFNKFTLKFSRELNTNKINKLDIESFLNQVKTFKIQQNTKYNICKNTKKFLNFLFEYGYTAAFVINKDVITGPEVKKKIIFTEGDYKLILENLSEKNNNFKVMVQLLTYTGLRPSDILNITGEDIDPIHETLNYFSQKLGKHRTVPIHSSLLPILIDRSAEVNASRLITYKSISQMGLAMRRYLKHLKLDKKGYNLRTFRKTFDSYGYENNMEPMSAAELLGHSAAIAQKHYREISMKRMKNELEKFQPFSKPVTLVVTQEGQLINSDK